MTKAVGKWAKVKAKIRASVFADIERIKAADRPSAILVLPLIFLIGTADDTLVDNTVALYAQAARRLALEPNELEAVENMVDREDLANVVEEKLRCVPETVRRELFAVAVISAAAARLEVIAAHHEALIRIAQALALPYTRKDLEEKVGYYNR